MPESDDLGKGGGKVRWSRNRLHHLLWIREPLPLVPLDRGQYLIDALADAGWSITDAMGNETGLTWLEIAAYVQCTDTLPEAVERRALHAMSRAYVEGKREGRNPLSIPPSER